MPRRTSFSSSRPSPAAGPRKGCAYRVGSVVLVDAQIDHTTGLYMLREKAARGRSGPPTPVYEDLTRGNPILRLLEHYCGVDRRRSTTAHFHPQGAERLDWQALPLGRRRALFAPPGRAGARRQRGPGDRRPRHRPRVFTAPGLAEIDDALFATMAESDCVMVDGTFWTDDEMIAMGLSKKRARDIGHLAERPASIEQLARLPRHVRRILIHINNTNPILDEASTERAIIESVTAWNGCYSGVPSEH